MSDVLLVAASSAFDDYMLYSAYFCRPNKTFRKTTHVAFYSGTVQQAVPKILGILEDVELTEKAVKARVSQADEHTRALSFVIAQMQAYTSRWHGRRAKVIFLSPHNSKDTIQLPWTIVNDLRTESGGTRPLVQGFRYFPLQAFARHPRTSSELLAIASRMK